MSLIDALERAVARPPPFALHDGPFWDDPHIGSQMLATHLDQATDAASHRLAEIQRRVDHLVGSLELRPGDRLLDLGCGPGLYAEAFAARGLLVSGIDISPVSIGYARMRARRAGLAIDYRVADYTADALGGPFNAAVMIYLDFGVLAEDPRDRLLEKVCAALAPAAPFVFDVKTPARARVVDGAISVTRHERGFWRPNPHLVVESTYRYPSNLDLHQYAIVDMDETITTYRVWDRAYSMAELRRLRARHGLRADAVWSDLAGEPWRRRSPTIAVSARTPVSAWLRGLSRRPAS